MTYLFAAALLSVLAWTVSAVFRPEPSLAALALFGRDLLTLTRERARLMYLSTSLENITVLSLLFIIWRKTSRQQRLFRSSHGCMKRPSVEGLVLGSLAGFFLETISLPFSYYRYQVNKSFGLVHMSPTVFLGDYIKGLILNVFVYALAGMAAAWLRSRFSAAWPRLLFATILMANLLASYMYPVLIAPMFNQFRPINDPTVSATVKELAARAGLSVDKVLVMDASRRTSAANAYFAGLGKTKQVVLYDTLIASQTPQGLALVIAHEFGHWKHAHVLKEVLLGSVGTWAVLEIFHIFTRKRNFSLERFLVTLWIFTYLVTFLSSPLSNWISRRFEIQADRFSIELTQDADGFISAQINLGRQNLSDVEPPPFIRWFAWTHPTTMERIGLAGSLSD